MNAPVRTSRKHSQSSIADWRRCKRYYKHRHVDRIREKSSGIAPIVGTWTHAGLEAWSNGAGTGDMIAAAFVHARDNDLAFLTSETGEVEWHRVRAMLRAYVSHWGKVEDCWESLETESYFQGGLEQHAVVGFQDGVIRMRDGELMLLERKTTASDVTDASDQYWLSLSYDVQLPLYLREVAKKYSVESPRTLYDVIIKPGSKGPGWKLAEGSKAKKPTAPKKRAKETDEEFEQRKASLRESLEEWEERLFREMTAEPSKHFIRRVISLTDQQVEDVIAETREELDEIESYQGSYPRNRGACKAFGRNCEYLEVCAGIGSLDDPKFVHLPSKTPTPKTTEGAIHGSSEFQCPI